MKTGIRSLAGAAAAVLLGVSVSSAQAPPTVAQRVELHPIRSVTLSDSQFLKGDEAGGTPVTVAGQLRIPRGEGRMPVVFLIHGSSGPGANIDIWSDQFMEMGVATFVLDGFTGRGLTSVSANQALLGRLNLIVDAYRGLEILAKHPRVDPSRIVLMGFSRGGQATLYASLKRFNRMWNKSGIQFAAHIPLYPDCSTTYVEDTDVDRPIRIFHGAADDYTPVSKCRAFVERLRTAGRDVQLTEYPDAPHTFDNPLGSQPPVVNPNSQSVRACTIREEPIGQLINAVTKQPFAYTDPCVERGPHTGYHPAAATAARQAVGEYLRSVFKLH
jgi:dienelactone hydrolase